MAYKNIQVTENAATVYLNEKKIAYVVEQGSGSAVYLDNQKVKDVKIVDEAPAAILALAGNMIALTEDATGGSWLVNHEIIVGLRDEGGKGIVTIETKHSKRNLVVTELTAATTAAINAL